MQNKTFPLRLLAFMMLCLILWKGLGAQESQASFTCGDIFTDLRDGQRYPTVQIGSQCWMAKNLNIGVVVPDFMQSDNGLIEKTCYDNDPANCEIFGGLYTWGEAMAWTTTDGGQGICPPGWHLPARADWDLLRRFLGYVEAGQKMKVDNTNTPPWDGTNSSGFAALPAGVGHGKYFGRKGHWSLFWSSTQANDNYAWFAQLDKFWSPAPEKYKILHLGDNFLKENGFSVRCVRGEN